MDGEERVVGCWKLEDGGRFVTVTEAAAAKSSKWPKWDQEMSAPTHTADSLDGLLLIKIEMNNT